MASLMRSHANGVIAGSIPNAGKVQGSKQPQHIRCTCSIQQLVCCVLKPSDCSSLNRILMLIVWLGELILDQELSIDVLNLLTLFFFGIVSAQGTGCTLIANEVAINAREFTLLFEAFNINVFGFETMENLCTIAAVTKALAIGKDGVGGHNLTQSENLENQCNDLKCFRMGWRTTCLANCVVCSNVLMTMSNGLQARNLRRVCGSAFG